MNVKTELVISDFHDNLRQYFLTKDPKSIREYALYSNIENEKLKEVFTMTHHKLNCLIKFMNSKSKSNNHYNAEESRQLFNLIDTIDEAKRGLSDSAFSFYIVDKYNQFIEYIYPILELSGGTPIPEEYTDFPIDAYEPIFIFDKSITLSNSPQVAKTFETKVIGGGQYSTVSSFYDTDYGINFALKQAKKNLTVKELERFKNEYEIMKRLDSPYIIEVYQYNESKDYFIMECADTSLRTYINTDNSSIGKATRLKIANQILGAFTYIHSKGIFHRDVSHNNVLIKFYDNTFIIKICDFGLVKDPSYAMTTTQSDIKGTFIDPLLEHEGFKNYSLHNEIYSLTKLLYYVMTGRIRFSNKYHNSVINFYKTGTNLNKDLRFKNVEELRDNFRKVKWD